MGAKLQNKVKSEERRMKKMLIMQHYYELFRNFASTYG
jgi:hypothetical protein